MPLSLTGPMEMAFFVCRDYGSMGARFFCSDVMWLVCKVYRLAAIPLLCYNLVKHKSLAALPGPGL